MYNICPSIATTKYIAGMMCLVLSCPLNIIYRVFIAIYCITSTLVPRLSSIHKPDIARHKCNNIETIFQYY